MPYSPGQQHDREEQEVENGEGKEGLGGRQVTSDDGECGEGAHCETAAIKRMEANQNGVVAGRKQESGAIWERPRMTLPNAQGEFTHLTTQLGSS